MKKILATSLLLISVSLNASDCIIAKELNVNFVNDSTKYVDTNKEIKKIKDFKKFIDQTDLYVLIQGHTNNIAEAKYNFNLSEQRAKTVMNELKHLGLKSNQVKAMGFGESSPLYSNDTEDGLNSNRRVIAETFNSAKERDEYMKSQQKRIKNIKFKEQ